MRKYTVLLIPDPNVGGYTVKVPALPGITTEGDTVAEALANAKEAIELYLEVLKERGQDIPEEAEHAQAIVIEVAA